MRKVLKTTFIALLAVASLAFGPLPSRAQIKFGATLTLTGSGTLVGQNARDGMELARDEINREGGVRGQPLEILYEDFGEQDLKRAVNAAQKFINVDKVSVLFPMITEDAEVIWPLAYQRKLVTMAIYAGGREVTRGKPLMFQVSSSDEVFGRVLSDYAIAKSKRHGCLLVEQSAYAISIGRFTADYWKQHSEQEPLLTEYNPDTVDFKSQLLKMRSNACEAIFLFTSIGRQAMVLNQMQAMKWMPLKLGLDTSEDPNIVDNVSAKLDNLVYVKYLVATPEFQAKFKARYHRDVGVPAALAYDAVRLVSKIIAEHGVDGEKISEGLLSVRNYPGASGQLTIDPDGTRHDRMPELWVFEGGVPRRLSK